jgi:SRSO17 transposase
MEEAMREFHSYYFNTKEEIKEHMKRRMRKNNYCIGFIINRDKLHLEEIIDLFNRHDEQYLAAYYKPNSNDEYGIVFHLVCEERYIR